jgi:hypothetical protein
MRFVELCFHERDALAADLAARGLGEAGLCVLRRPATDARAPSPSPATERRIFLHSPHLDALADDHPVFAGDAAVAAIAIQLGHERPREASRSWLVAPATLDDLRASGFWKVIARTGARSPRTAVQRRAAQDALLTELKALRPGAPVRRAAAPTLGVAQMAAAAALVLAAGASVFVLEAAARPDAVSGSRSEARAAADPQFP